MKKQFYLSLLFISFAVSLVSAQTKTDSFIKVEGEVTNALTLYASDLAKMKRIKASMKEHDGTEFQYEGVLVSDLLRLAGVTLGAELKGKNLRKYLLIKAADGYQVVFSLAELDSSFTDRTVLLADKRDGNPLPADKGPFRIIIPGEKKHARCIYQVTAFVLCVAKE